MERDVPELDVLDPELSEPELLDDPDEDDPVEPVEDPEDPDDPDESLLAAGTEAEEPLRESVR
ncbi:hypothetical protein [Nostocoides sp. HKS02]|uniref:hypothetical protein n=1 Tax=Nostocoides sp. HKS02 TaxID=1813880 RepID=UPI00351B9D82